MNAAVLAAIDSAYGNRLKPTFNFVSTHRARETYCAILSELHRCFDVVDTTDENDDVALVLALRRNERTVTLYLSMVGRFAALLTNEEGTLRFIGDEATRGEPDLAMIGEALRGGGVALIRGEALRQNVALRLPDEPGATMFRALFSSIDPVASE